MLPPIRPVLALVAALSVLLVRSAAAETAAEVGIYAALRFERPEIAGTEVVRLRNDTSEPVRTVRFLLFANRFHSSERLDDLARHLLVARGGFETGSAEVDSAKAASLVLERRIEPTRDGDCLLAVDLAEPLAPGESIVLTLRFRTTLPNLLDVFGSSPGLVVADGGWYPEPLPLGSGAEARRPNDATVHAVLDLPEGSELLANGALLHGRSVRVENAEGRLSLVLSSRPFEVERRRIDGRQVTLYSAPSGELVHRLSGNEAPVEEIFDRLPAILARSSDRFDRTIVRLPLRYYISAVAPGMIFVSDRLFEIFPVLRPLHARELAYAFFLDEELRAAVLREPEGDARWVAEGLAWRRADRLYRDEFRGGTREVRDWIRLFRLFAIVDRFETAPRIAFLRPFFPTLASDDPLRIRRESLYEDSPPGRVVFDKLEARLRPAAFAALLERYGATRRGFRELWVDSGEPAARDARERYLAAWLRPYPRRNYVLEKVEGGVPTRIEVAREGDDDRPDSIEVGVEEEGGAEQRFFLDLDEPRAAAELPTRAPGRAVTLDPDRKALETRLDDDRIPPRWQLLLDSADVEVSSTEFGFSTLFVARRRYDYRKDLAAAGFYTDRAYGGQLGFQLHGGPQIDSNLFRHNLFVYYSVAALDHGFHQDDEPERRDRGRLGGLGLRFNSYDAFWFENPSRAYHLRLFVDGYDRSLGSDFDFVQGGGSLTLTERLRDDVILAGQVLNGWTAPTGRGRVPVQGLFSLGGFRSIRGIGANEELARDIFLVRVELRHLLPIRLDLNFEDALIARRLQAKLFVDAGRVGDSGRRLFRPADFAVGVGGGVNLFYDFFGFFPTSFYLDLAKRVDESGGVQVLFGARQPF